MYKKVEIKSNFTNVVAGLVTAGYSHSKAIELLERQDVRVIYRSRRTDLAATMKGQSYAANDPIFDQFTRLGSKGSGTVYSGPGNP